MIARITEGAPEMKFAVLSLAVMLVACSDRSPGDEKATSAPVSIESLLAEVDKLSDQCRGGSGDSQKTLDACDLRDAKLKDVADRGWCWGPKDAAGAKQHWMRCADDKSSEVAASPGAKVVSLSQLKKMTVVGMEPFKPYRVSTKINALDLGTDGLCDQLRYDGYCEMERERVYVNINLESQAARGQLYDLRGKTGAAICATVVMHPRNVNGTLNLVGFTAGLCR